MNFTDGRDLTDFQSFASSHYFTLYHSFTLTLAMSNLKMRLCDRARRFNDCTSSWAKSILSAISCPCKKVVCSSEIKFGNKELSRSHKTRVNTLFRKLQRLMGRNSLKDDGFFFFGSKTISALLTSRAGGNASHELLRCRKQISSDDVPAMTKENSCEAIRAGGAIRIKTKHR